jgi:hypothetical protein
MKTTEKTAFCLYLINSCICFIFGVRYLLCDTIMPYHEEAIGLKWEALESGMQVFLNSTIKMTASGFFVVGSTVLVLLLIPFRKGELWAKWFIPGLSLLYLCFALYVPINIALKTQASTPWPASIVGMVLTIIAFLLSGVFSTKRDTT